MNLPFSGWKWLVVELTRKGTGADLFPVTEGFQFCPALCLKKKRKLVRLYVTAPCVLNTAEFVQKWKMDIRMLGLKTPLLVCTKAGTSLIMPQSKRETEQK